MPEKMAHVALETGVPPSLELSASRIRAGPPAEEGGCKPAACNPPPPPNSSLAVTNATLFLPRPWLEGCAGQLPCLA